MMTKKELHKICKVMDSRLRIDKEKKQQFAVEKGYKYFNEYIFKEYTHRTASDIGKEIESFGITPVVLSTIHRVVQKIKEEHLKPKNGKEKEFCQRGCGRRIADGNHWYCKKCEYQNKQVNIDPTFYEIHI